MKNVCYKPLFAFCLLLVTSITFGQHYKLDSLYGVLKSQKREDTIRVSTLLHVSYYHMDHEVEKALPFLEEALKISKKLNIKSKEITVCNYLSRFYRMRGLNDMVMKYALKAKKKTDSFGTKAQKIKTNSELLYAYGVTGNINESLSLAEENLTLIKDDPVSSDKAKMYFDIGNVYLSLKQYDKAEKEYLTAITICRDIDFKSGEMVMMSRLATLYKNQKRYKEAIEYLNEVISYYKSIGGGTGRAIASPYYNLATIKSLKGEHAASIPMYEKALTLFQKSGNLQYCKNINQHLFIAYSILGAQKKAEMANKRYVTIKDSIYSIERRKIVEEMKTKYEVDKINAEKKAAEIKTSFAEATSKRNLNYFIGAVVITILILISSLFFLGRLKARKKAELIVMELRETQKRLALEKQYRDSELKALKAQMNPHFIFNALNSIQKYIVLNKKMEACDYLGRFASLMRTYLRHSDTGKISLGDEIDSLTLYLDLESLRFSDTFQYKIDIAENLNKDGIHIPSMLIQPYVENALKHGLLHKKENRRLIVSFLSEEEKSLTCIIQDNGVGRTKSKEFQEKRGVLHRSFATRATEERLNLINYKKERKIGVDIVDLYSKDNEPMGTKVILNIPIIQ